MTYEFPTSGMAARFARNAHSRGYTVERRQRRVTVDETDDELRTLIARYPGPTTDETTQIR